jgi:hypothetical protein
MTKSIIKRLAKLEAHHSGQITPVVRLAHDSRPSTEEGGCAIRIQFVDAGETATEPPQYRNLLLSGD